MQHFKTKSQVVDYLNSLVDGGMLFRHSDGWSTVGTYYLSHGEYSQPDYRPSRYKDGWGISIERYYYPGTINVPTGRHRINL